MNNELYHWKYIKRVWVNGKWKYYYDWDQLKSDTGVTQALEYKKASDASDEANRLRVDAASRAADSSKRMSQKKYASNSTNTKLNLPDGISLTVKKWSNKRMYDKAVKNSNGSVGKTHTMNMRNLAKYTKASIEADKAKSKAFESYIGTPLSYITHPSENMKRTFKRGKAWLDRVFGD